MKRKLFLLIITLCIFTSLAYAQNNNLKLLAVSESENGTLSGGVADLFLEIKEGSGQVFIDTYPLSKFDTQLSIRFAKDMACKFSELDCSKYDFLYTIRADSRIIGGPSAGAAVAVLTYAQLNKLDINDSVAMTGTINSGRLIGNVGGIKEKIEGASQNNLKKVLIPIGELIQKEEDNTTFNMIEHGIQNNITVIPVSDLEEALYHFTGIQFRKEKSTITIDPNYADIMQNISDQLCLRSQEIISLIENTSFIITNATYNGIPLNKTYKNALDLIENSNSVYSNSSYYSSASQCYGANNLLYFIYLVSLNSSNDYYETRIQILQSATDLLQENMARKNFTSIPELQTSMIIRQRLTEAQDYIDKITEFDFNNSNISKNKRDQMVSYTSLAVERLYTTSMWAQFFKLEGEEFMIDYDLLRSTCESIIIDAQARIEYAQLYLPERFSQQREELESLNIETDPAFCIAQASQIKADVNALISAFGLSQDDVKDVILRKLDKATEILNEEILNGRFPILGYSYYEYALTLADTEPTSALIYSEYALEFSNLDIYINAPKYIEKPTPSYIKSHITLILFSTLLALLCFLLGIQLTKKYYKRHFIIKKKSKSKRKH